MRGVDQGDMREGLRIVAHLPPCPWIVFFGEQTDIVAQRQQPLEQRAGVVVPALQDVVVGVPKAAGNKRPFVTGQASRREQRRRRASPAGAGRASVRPASILAQSMPVNLSSFFLSHPWGAVQRSG